MLEARLSRRAFCVLRGRATPAERRVPRERARETGIGRNPSPLGRSAAESVPLGNSRGTCLAGCHGSVRRRRKQAGPVALEQSRGKKRPPRAAARQLPHRDAARAREGDGNQPESVALGTPHGRIRPPRQLSRHLPCGMSRNRAKATEIGQNPSPSATLAAPALRDVTESREGDGNRAKSVPLGGFRGSRPLPRSAIM